MKKRTDIKAVFFMLALVLIIVFTGCKQQEIKPGNDDININYPTGKIDFYIAYSPGGGYDTYARGIIPFLSKHLPGQPVISPVNMEGAGGRVAAQYLFRQSPDGYKIGIWDGTGMALGQAIYDVEYDLKKVSWIGRATTEVNYFTVNPNGRYRSLEDLLAADDVVVAITGVSSLPGIASIIFFDTILGKKLTIIPHGGSSEAITSVLRGDADVLAFAVSTVAPLIKSGDLIPVMQISTDPYPFPGVPADVPTAAELGYHEIAALSQERLIGGPPGMDPKIVRILSDALLAAQNDPELLKWAEDNNRFMDPLPAEEVTKLVNTMVEVMEKFADDIKKYLEN
jgi:tripartite-type tricarboxylate transporter receptor subunit TctC